MGFDITTLPQRYLDALGRAEVARITGQTEQIVAMWAKRGKFPIDALQRLLDHDPSPLNEVRPLSEVIPLGHKLIILMPLAGSPEPKTLDTLMRLYDRREMAFDRFSFNNLSVSRNALAARFLNGPWEWAYWMDGDSLLPCGDAKFFKDAAELPQMSDVFAGLHSIYRSLTHYVKGGRKDATIVSVSYVSRRIPAIPQFGGDVITNCQEVRSGPRDVLKEVPWVGMGGCLTHRSVFEDIIKTQGEEIRMKPNGIGNRFNYQWAFFHPIDIETNGDDVPLCVRAKRAGHKVFVDMALQAAHLGDRAYTYADIR